MATKGTAADDLGATTAQLLCSEIAKGGVVDSSHQGLMVSLMALTPEDVSRIRLGKLTPHCIRTLRHLRDFFGIMFRIRADAEDGTVLLSCVGTGFKNMSRRYT